MHILQITPGTGDFHCGCSIRDGALLLELRRSGHHVTCLPLYLPLVTEEGSFTDAPIFFSGLSVFLEQKISWLRRMPRVLDRLLSHPALLKTVASHADMTSASKHGDMTISMLRGEDGHQAFEIDKLVAWIRENESPDVIVLSMSLLAGMARALRREIQVPIVCSLQGEDAFLDSLPPTLREQAWALLIERMQDIDAFIAPSHAYAKYMCARTACNPDRVHVVYNGINAKGIEERSGLPDPARIGFFSRICSEKGIATLIAAFVHLRTQLGDKGTQLVIAGAMTKADRRFFAPYKSKLKTLGLWQDVELHCNVSKVEKYSILRSLSLLSVPTTYDEAFGLYMAEAMSCGVPVVQPDRGAFMEIIAASGAGILHVPDDAKDLARQWKALLDDPARNEALGAKARAFALKEFAVSTMARRVTRVYQGLPRPPHGETTNPLSPQ